MTTKSSEEKGTVEYFKIIISVILFGLTAYMGVIDNHLMRIENTLNGIDERLFKHLTNDELHAPRSLVITRPEFSLYQEMRSKEMTQLGEGIHEIKILLQEHRKETNYKRWKKKSIVPTVGKKSRLTVGWVGGFARIV
jgi:hypothetical protein